ncbi:eukaryotic elongation factor 2 kinase [Anaeramoeba flamelloides]|uniref:Eukaryotic elongation factor 2 kinase n=1 Tax=Anaeramoeba flamelloides TaxID=1746091 RepID=A0ABQ8X5K4_9EUKA|nr:eukaryotic elongation factor 2 kinase [Anaeramoeba flamelloides]
MESDGTTFTSSDSSFLEERKRHLLKMKNEISSHETSFKENRSSSSSSCSSSNSSFYKRMKKKYHKKKEKEKQKRKRKRKEKEKEKEKEKRKKKKKKKKQEKENEKEKSKKKKKKRQKKKKLSSTTNNSSSITSPELSSSSSSSQSSFSFTSSNADLKETTQIKRKKKKKQSKNKRRDQTSKIKKCIETKIKNYNKKEQTVDKLVILEKQKKIDQRNIQILILFDFQFRQDTINFLNLIVTRLEESFLQKKQSGVVVSYSIVGYYHHSNKKNEKKKNNKFGSKGSEKEQNAKKLPIIEFTQNIRQAFEKKKETFTTKAEEHRKGSLWEGLELFSELKWKRDSHKYILHLSSSNSFLDLEGNKFLEALKKVKLNKFCYKLFVPQEDENLICLQKLLEKEKVNKSFNLALIPFKKQYFNQKFIELLKNICCINNPNNTSKWTKMEKLRIKYIDHSSTEFKGVLKDGNNLKLTKTKRKFTYSMNPFDSGNECTVRHMLDECGNHLVIKFPLSIEELQIKLNLGTEQIRTLEQLTYNECVEKLKICYVSKYLCRQFNSKKPSQALDVIEGFVCQVPNPNNSNEMIWVIAEPYMKGNYIRYTDNSDLIFDHRLPNSKILESFVHFTYHYTKKKLIVCDIQGIGLLLTDLLLATLNPTSNLDFGQKAIQNFLNGHQCNKVCKNISLPKNKLFIDNNKNSIFVQQNENFDLDQIRNEQQKNSKNYELLCSNIFCKKKIIIKKQRYKLFQNPYVIYCKKCMGIFN